MKTPEENTCPNCGAEVSSGSAGSLCPACAMSQALKDPADSAEPTLVDGGAPDTIAFSPPSPSAFPCELGRYRLLGELGKGGMGAVYEAVETATGRRLALKMLGQKLNNPDMRQRFLREGRLAASVSHPNSLYVFGTEEIDGAPVITMELAAGGTLADRIKQRGPIPVNEAVDIILQVIAGLEAAFAGGVLHRDVKPSNCFVDPDGTVKVGDFGLSVSTTAQVDSFMTATGVIMGTPAYAPPEQLRGKDLDHRADIYSVGATLFSLLTGKPPIEAANAVEIVAAALEQKPELASDLNADVPRGLAQVIARCLAKKPEQRFADYQELRNALMPFNSAQPEPAPIPRRLIAGSIDWMMIWMAPVILVGVPLGIPVDSQTLLEERTLPVILAHMGYMTSIFLYYTILEGIWGASVGKMLLGIRVTRKDGQIPGWGRAFGRIAIGNAPTVIVTIIGLIAFTAAGSAEARWLQSANFLGCLMFLTMRRRNGYATVGDLATGTRVVMTARGSERPEVEVDEWDGSVSDKAAKIGNFVVDEEIVPNEWVAARDPALRRQVWLRRRTGEAIRATRRDLARPGRNRWLQSVETPDTIWDVFEARTGRPMRSLLDDDRRVGWGSLRHWLHDIASEAASAARDETLPPTLSLDHVWITDCGRAVLLDEPWPKADEPADVIGVETLEGQQRFLNAMTSCAKPPTVPLHARPMMESLAAGSFEKLSFVAGNLRSLLTAESSLTRRHRALSLLLVPLTLAGFLIFGLPIGVKQGRHYDPNNPVNEPRISIWDAAEWGDLQQIRKNLIAGTEPDAREADTGNTPLMLATTGKPRAIALLLALGANVDLQNNDGWTALHHAAWFGYTDTTRMLIARGADLTLANNAGQTPLDMVSAPWSAEIEAAYERVESRFKNHLNLDRIRPARPEIFQFIGDPASVRPPVVMTKAQFDQEHARNFMFGAFVLTMQWALFFVAVAQLFGILTDRATIGQFTFGFAVVDARGELAGRLRLLARWSVAWILPVLIAHFLPIAFGDLRGVVSPLFIGLLLIYWIALLATAIARPERGLLDRMTGCWLVPR